MIEVKYAQQGKLETECRHALEQIGKKGYAKRFQEEGMDHILKYGIACFRSRCRVAVESGDLTE